MSRRGAIFLVLLTGIPWAAGPAAAAGPRPGEGLPAICRMIDAAAAGNHLPAGLLTRLLWQESRFRGNATSPAGAQGIAQFMPPAAADEGVADPRDPGPAIAAAARLLDSFARRFGNLGLAVAAYNAGAGRLEKWLRGETDLPPETRLYVRAVTGRRVEDWGRGAADRGLAFLHQGMHPNTCLALAAQLARPAPAAPSLSGWRGRLDRLLARALRAAAAGEPPRARPAPGARALCDRIRSLGASCIVYER